MPDVPCCEVKVGVGGRYSKAKLLAAASFFGLMTPLPSSMLTVMVWSVMPRPLTCTDSTNTVCVPLEGVTAVITSKLPLSRLKSLTATPLTAASNVAVKYKVSTLMTSP